MITINFCQDGKKSIEIDAESVADAVEKAINGGVDLSCVNLNGADLCGIDLSGINLRGSKLMGVDLRWSKLDGTDFRGADLDFSCWPLWCGSLGAKIDKKIFCQLLYHVVRAGQSVDDPEVLELLKKPAIIDLANQFHRADECGKIINAGE